METDKSDEIRFKDLRVLRELLQTKSLREVARRLGTSPGQLSKIVKNLERRLGKQLLNRSMHGIEVTPEAADLLPHLERILALQQKVRGELDKKSEKNLYAVASTSFLSTHLLPEAFAAYQNFSPSARFRLIDLPPAQFVPVGLRSGFQICVHIDSLDWPRTWTSIEVGQVNWELYCRTRHPLGPRPTVEKVLQYPFVFPVYWSEQGLRFGDDSCPVPIEKRIRGSETATATAAAEIVRHTDQIGFLPDVVMKPLLQHKLVRRVSTPSWKEVRRTVYLTVKSDSVRQSAFLNLRDVLQRLLSESRE